MVNYFRFVIWLVVCTPIFILGFYLIVWMVILGIECRKAEKEEERASKRRKCRQRLNNRRKRPQSLERAVRQKSNRRNYM